MGFDYAFCALAPSRARALAARDFRHLTHILAHMRIRSIAIFSAAVIALACGREHAAGVSSGGPRTEDAGARWRIVDNSAVGVWWNPMVDNATVYRIRVQRAGDSVDVADVI